jgi:hypothetical protein
MVLTLWGLMMITPDLLRVGQPLGSIGFFANNDGFIYDANGPFDEEADSPAWRAGIRVGDQLDLKAMRCTLADLRDCGNALAVLAGVDYVLPGAVVTVDLAASARGPARQITLVAEQPPSNFFVRSINLLCQIAGILVILAASWLVWTRPGAMSWGFFLYVNWFNPGQVYAFYAILAHWPLALFAQNIAAGIAEGAGYAGLLLFVLRVPNNETEPAWLPLERTLPVIGALLSLLLISTYGAVLGFPTETLTRASILAGFLVDLGALGILFVRRRTQTPEDYQRVRWVIWGCLIGLPAFLLAELASTTTIFETRWGDFTPDDDIIGLLYLINGVLCLFVFEALRRPRVVSVTIPLRRVTILGLTLSLPVLFLHREVERIQEHLPPWAWLAIGAVSIFLITRLHEGAVHLADRYFNRALDAAERELGAALLKAKGFDEIDRLLAKEPFQRLKLTSAASFRRDGARFVRGPTAEGWDGSAADTLDPGAPLLQPIAKGRPFTVPENGANGDGADLPQGLARPVLGVPASSPLRCFAVSLYGPHQSGTDLDANERAMLARLAADAAVMYAEIEASALRGELARLELKLLKREPLPDAERTAHGDL